MLVGPCYIESSQDGFINKIVVLEQDRLLTNPFNEPGIVGWKEVLSISEHEEHLI